MREKRGVPFCNQLRLTYVLQPRRSVLLAMCLSERILNEVVTTDPARHTDVLPQQRYGTTARELANRHLGRARCAS